MKYKKKVSDMFSNTNKGGEEGSGATKIMLKLLMDSPLFFGWSVQEHSR